MFVPLTTPNISSPKVVSGAALRGHSTSPRLTWATLSDAVFASQHMLTCASLPLQEKAQVKYLLFLAFISVLSTPVSLSGGAAAWQGSRVGTCCWGSVFNAWGAPSLHCLLDVLCSGIVYLLFDSLCLCSPSFSYEWRAARGGTAGVTLWVTWSPPHPCR